MNILQLKNARENNLLVTESYYGNYDENLCMKKISCDSFLALLVIYNIHFDLVEKEELILNEFLYPFHEIEYC